ncbi:MAG: HEAT repeat domain-containing protein [Thermoguttaceae bacterium]
MPLQFKRFAECAILMLVLPAVLGIAGCRDFAGATLHDSALAAVDAKAGSKNAASSQAPAESGASTLSAGDRAVLARIADKDPKGRTRSVWIRTVDSGAEFHWHYPKLEDILARPSNRQPDFRALLSDADPIVAVNSALVLARAGDGAGRERLIDAVRSPELPLPARCAAVEALANLKESQAVDSLKDLLDQYGRFGKEVKAPYISELHAELIRGSARHVDPAGNSAFIEALRSPAADVRLEALKAYAASPEKTLPIEAVDLRTDGDWRIRAAALEAIASRRHPQAADYLSSGLTDGDARVRQSAIASLGILGTTEALATLQKMLKDPNDAVRAQAVSALAAAKVEGPVIDAAADQSWRVRRKAADALALFPDQKAESAAQRLLDDGSSEVQLAAVRAIEAWPLERSGPILLAAMSKPAFITRKTAAEELIVKWPAAKEFPLEGPPERRAEVLNKLNQAFRGQFSTALGDCPDFRGHRAEGMVGENGTVPFGLPLKKASPEQVAEVERLLREMNLKALADYGPALVDALEQLHFDRKQLLPEEIYRDVLSKYGHVYAALDQLASADLAERRRAAEELAELSGKQPPGRLAIARLSQLVAKEQDALVWQSAMQAISDDPSQPAIDLAYTAIGNVSAEVRRRACEHLAAHPDPAHVPVLIPALEDKDHAVICAAARALAATGNMSDTKPLRNLLGSMNEDIQLEAALALTRLGDQSGKPALERLAYSRDPAVRARTAQAMGDFPDTAFTATLIHLLNDTQTVARAALSSLPKVVGEDVAQTPGQAPATSTEQILRWKHWHERQSAQ